MEAEQAAVQEAEQEAEQETGQEAEQETGKEAEKDKQPGGGFLAIWGLTNAQYCTTEWSAQGVARTISQAIDAANRTGRTLVLAGTKGWLDRKMPLLNTDVDTTGITHLLERKMVTVRGVLKRWFRIPREEEGGRKRKRKRKMGEKDEKEEKEEHDKLNKIKRKAPATSGSGTSGTSAGNKDSQPKRIKF
ncbi:hypothetical protein BZA77DRAFT_23072 [Pyronema omphalodes]|nr:hypothetical protein BZA77DRAFT_140131 [Pyronema omphalodes]KAI5817984.1 hypothetical protein BZA77DRAFT_23072 [Pyronema omphalodes]